MMDEPGKSLPSDDSAAPVPLIDSRAGFAAAIQWGFGRAAAGGARRIVCVDRDFAQWPLDDPALLDGLTAWLRRPQRELVLLASSFDEVPRRLPRFTVWRRYWTHGLSAWRAPADLDNQLPTLLLDDGALMVRLIDAVHWRGRVTVDAQAVRPYRDEIDAVLQRSEPAFAATQLGL
jgi:hypothetical protein